MKKGFEEIVAWQYDGWTAIGVLYGSNDYISVAVNYRMDSNIRKGDIWWVDGIYKDEGTEVRFANAEEVKQLIDSLDIRGIKYKFDRKTWTIRIYDVYPTKWMRFKNWIKGLFN